MTALLAAADLNLFPGWRRFSWKIQGLVTGRTGQGYRNSTGEPVGILLIAAERKGRVQFECNIRALVPPGGNKKNARGLGARGFGATVSISDR